jgi:hypothetical protein
MKMQKPGRELQTDSQLQACGRLNPVIFEIPEHFSKFVYIFVLLQVFAKLYSP